MINTTLQAAHGAEMHVEYPKVGKALLLLFCGYVVIWYLQIGHRFPILGAIRFEFAYAAILSAFALLATPRGTLSSPLIPYVVLYFLVIIIQVPFSSDPDTSWNVFLDRIIKFAFMAFFIVSFVRSPDHLKYFLAAFLLACLKMGQEGLIGKITGGLIWENQGIMRLHGATPLYEHPNSFSGMALGTLPFLYFLWPLCNRYCKILLFLLGMFSLNIIVFTGSRTGYVGFAVFIACLFFSSANKKRFIAGIALISLLSAPFIPEDYYGRFASIFTGKDKEGQSTELRMEILRDAWQIFEEHPLGVGVSAFPKVRMETFGRTQDTHNLYLEIATNLGIQGFIVVGLLFYKLLKTLSAIKTSARRLISGVNVRASQSARNLDDLKLIEAVASATIMFLIVRLALGMFGMDLYEIYWWFAIGIAIALEQMIKKLKVLSSV